MLKTKTKYGIINWTKPSDYNLADITTNIAFKLSKELKKNPILIANEILEEIKNFSEFESVVNVNGFINVRLSKNFLIEFIFKILENNFIENDEPKNYIIEFVSANPTGPLNVVNARAGAIGDSIVRIGKFLRHNVISEYYVNDEGNQILSLGYSILWRLNYVFHFKVNNVYIENQVKNEPKILIIDNEEIELDVYKGDYVIEIAKNLKDMVEKEIKNFKNSYKNKEEFLNEFNNFAYKIGKLASDLIFNKQMEVLKKYGVSYDSIVRESFIRNSEYPKIVLEKLKNYLYFEDLEKNQFEVNEKDISKLLDKSYYLEHYKNKALVLRTTIYNDDKDRVLIRSNGEPTYFFWDIAYHYYKILRLNKNGYIINLLGPDHYGYIPRLTSALRMLGFENLNILIIQQTNLIKNGVKLDMSKRKGQIYEMEELINEVGVSASRFFFLLRSPSSHLDFDIDLAKKLSSENPVYYVQYAHARIESIKENAKNVGINLDFNKNYLLEYDFKNERKMIVYLFYFEEIVKKAFYNLEPHLIVYYLLEISEMFHSYYQKYRVIDIEDKFSTIARLIILSAVQKIINLGLSLIGVSAPKRM
ncbi:MAG: arginine--tRNA ligase [Candidatus Hydrothermia bacterium]|jgi:arginyl-tRNA synthetase|nr:arginine--tRNA ligase [Candidatus Hydrothermia bacterium]